MTFIRPSMAGKLVYTSRNERMQDMSMPREITGSAFNGEKSQNFKLTFVKEGGRPSHAVYADESGKEWYIKADNQATSVREALAANFFRYLTGEKFSPETHYLRGNDAQHYVISAFTQFNELSPHGPHANLAPCLLGSYVLNDRDCQPKNIKEFNGNTFRIDFGAAGPDRDSLQETIPFLNSLQDLRIGFNVRPFFEKFSGDDFINYAHYLGSLSVRNFPWESWLKHAGASANELMEWRESIEKKMALISQHVRPTSQHPPAEKITLTEDNIKLREKLVAFYGNLLKSKQQVQDDFIFNPIEPSLLADRHLAFLSTNKKHPSYFMDILESAYKAKDKMTTAPFTPFDQYVVANFSSEEFKIHRVKPIFGLTMQALNTDQILAMLKTLQSSSAIKQTEKPRKIEIDPAESSRQQQFIEKRRGDTVDPAKPKTEDSSEKKYDQKFKP